MRKGPKSANTVNPGCIVIQEMQWDQMAKPQGWQAVLEKLVSKGPATTMQARLASWGAGDGDFH